MNASNMSLHVSFYTKSTITKFTLEVFLPLVNVSYVTLEIAIEGAGVGAQLALQIFAL